MRRVFPLLFVLLVTACGSASPEGPTDGSGSGSDIDAGIDGPPPAEFNVISAESQGTSTVVVTFDATPDPTEAADPSHYSIPGLTLVGGPQIGNSKVTLTTSAQSDQTYTVTVSGVTREGDHQPLTNAAADFQGTTAFDATDAAATSSVSFTVTFDAPPNAAQATNLANYTVAGLALNGTPTLAGNTVTLHSAGQEDTDYTVEIANVTRDADGEPLSVDQVAFAGIPVLAPTVTNVVVASTLPDNGVKPFNTGTTTVTITGTDFETVACPDGVALDDLDGAGTAVATKATTCTVDSGTQITATFPAGIRTNGATGWNVQVTNQVATNPTSAVTFVPLAGLVISEVYTGTSGSTDHEYIEVYNPTATDFDPSTLHLHVRNGAGTDTDKALTAVTASAVPPLGFLLLSSSASTASDVWFSHEDMTYSAALVGNGGAYLSLSGTKDAQVLDKVGWGTQAAPGFEGTAAANVASNFSISRKPGQHIGHGVDSDDNSVDFDAPTTTLTPRGTADGAEPGPTFDVLAATSIDHDTIVVQFSAPPSIEAATATNYSFSGSTVAQSAEVDGDTVTLTTIGQTSTAETLTVANVTRGFDALPLTVKTADFVGRSGFFLVSAVSTSATTVDVTFSDAPDPTAAATLGNYSIAGLGVTGTPVLNGSVVTLTTATQAAQTFTLTVSNVARASDGELLQEVGTDSRDFTGTAPSADVPTVTNVVVVSTVPDNGTTPFNTGTTTVTITGTAFTGVTCPAGVTLDDVDLTGTAVNTVATACTVDSDTQITATFPAGIKTNAATGWNVLVTNANGTNGVSAVKYVPRAGLVISEVFPGVTGNNLHEFVEIYNPTAQDVDLTNLKLHVRSTNGIGDTNKALTFLGGKTLPSHTFFMMSSSQSLAADAWRVVADATYSATAGGELVQNGGVCISLVGTANKKILDCVGWGTVGPLPIEGAATANAAPDQSIQRLPGAGAGAGTDTDNNLADFFAPSATIGPKGIVSGAEP